MLGFWIPVFTGVTVGEGGKRMVEIDRYDGGQTGIMVGWWEMPVLAETTAAVSALSGKWLASLVVGPPYAGWHTGVLTPVLPGQVAITVA